MTNKSTSNTQIFSTGVHLEAVKCKINNQSQWRWIATNFEDESYMNGEPINPVEYAEKQKDMIKKFI